MKINAIIKKIRHKVEWKLGNYRIANIAKQKPKYGVIDSPRNTPKIIVSLTTYDKRIGSVDIVIKSILRQSMKADKILLYLGEDVADGLIPIKLKKLKEFGLQIITGCEDIKPHKKYYYAMQENPDDIIITIDDDVVYDKNLIRDLMEAHKKHPKAVICRRANVIKRDSNGRLLPYSQWPSFNKNDDTEHYNLLPTGAGGILYPPHALDNEVFNIENIKQYCLYADDIWLRFMGVKLGTPVVFCAPINRYLATIPQTQETGLYLENVDGDRNDKYLRIMEKKYNWKIDYKEEYR